MHLGDININKEQQFHLTDDSILNLWLKQNRMVSFWWNNKASNPVLVDGKKWAYKTLL